MIDAKRVNEILMDCLFKKEDLDGGRPKEGIEWVEVASVQIRLGLGKSQLELHRGEIVSMLGELSDEFKESGGGGMSFLKACVDKDGVQWGEHRNIDELLALGIGLGLVSFPIPRDMWKSLPGSVPYICIDL